MDITKFALTKKQVTLMVIFLLCFSGIMSYFTMSRAENPSYIVRVCQIVTLWPGASPERVANLVSDKIEKHLQEIAEIDFIESESKTGSSVIHVHVLDQYKDMRPIWDNVRRKVEDAERELPESTHKPLINDEFGDVFGIVLSLSWDGFEYSQIKDVADDMKDDLLEIDDVAKVDIYGAQEERIFIEYNNDKLKELSLTMDDLQYTLKERNIIKSGGIINGSIQRIAIEPTGNYESLQDIKNTLIQIPQTNKIISLNDIANVYRGYIDPPSNIMHSNESPSLGVAISMREGGNILKLGKHVNDLIERYQNTYPIGIEFSTVADQPERVVLKIQEFVLNLIQAVIIVCFVMFLFLGFRTGFIVASLIPTAILITFCLMFFFKLGLNQITLASLIIALGMLVDNAIVMSESILVQIKQGEKPFNAALNSAKELKIPLLISSLTTSAAFLPFYLAKSGTGEYVGSLFTVVTITLLSSWTISLTLIPILCEKFLQKKIPKYPKGLKKRYILVLKPFLKRLKRSTKQSQTLFDLPIYKGYRYILLSMLKHRFLTLSILLILFSGTLFCFKFVPKAFFPPSNTPMFTAEIELPVDSSIFYTEKTIKQIERFVTDNLLVNEKNKKHGITEFSAFIGNGGPRYRLQHDPKPANPHYGFMLFHVTAYKDIKHLIESLESYIYNNLPNVKASIKPLEEGTPVDNPIEIRISGKDQQKIFNIVDKVKTKLESIPGTKNTDDDWGLKGKKIVINIDQDRAKRAGVTNSDIAKSLESAITGVKLTEFREDDELIPIVLRSEIAENLDLIGTEAFNIFSQSEGYSVPLDQVATISVEWEPSIIFRRNRLDTVTLLSDIEPGLTAHSINSQIIPFLEEESKNWPLGYRWQLGGEKEEAGKAQSSIFAELPLAIIVIIVLLMLQFNSVSRTFIILMTIPMSFIGVIMGLLLTKSYFGIMSILGTISLGGIVINNAIVLLDRIKIEIETHQLQPQDAIVQAAQKRMRPILLTTITTISSLIPLWFGGGPLWAPMTIAIIFGLLVATLLTLGLVPVLYSLFFKVNFKNFQYKPITTTKPLGENND